MRVALGGIWHETNSFAPSRTTLQDFHDYQYADADELVERYAATGTEVGGAIRAAQELGVELVPLPFAAAIPSGLVDADAFATLSEQLVAAAARACRWTGSCWSCTARCRSRASTTRRRSWSKPFAG